MSPKLVEGETISKNLKTGETSLVKVVLWSRSGNSAVALFRNSTGILQADPEIADAAIQNGVTVDEINKRLHAGQTIVY